MPRGVSDAPDTQKASAKLREQAARARRLAAGMTSRADRGVLIKLAEELEAEAAELERAEG
jgi:hypothetical protein